MTGLQTISQKSKKDLIIKKMLATRERRPCIFLGFGYHADCSVKKSGKSLPVRLYLNLWTVYY